MKSGGSIDWDGRQWAVAADLTPERAEWLAEKLAAAQGRPAESRVLYVVACCALGSRWTWFRFLGLPLADRQDLLDCILTRTMSQGVPRG